MNVTDVFIKPVITERTMQLIVNNNTYTFVVNRAATKDDIKQACQNLFGVNVVSVQTMRFKGGKRKMFSRKMVVSQASDWKKAIITLKSGQTLDLFDTGEEKKETKEKTKAKKVVTSEKTTETKGKKSLTGKLLTRGQKKV